MSEHQQQGTGSEESSAWDLLPEVAPRPVRFCVGSSRRAAPLQPFWEQREELRRPNTTVGGTPCRVGFQPVPTPCHLGVAAGPAPWVLRPPQLSTAASVSRELSVSCLALSLLPSVAVHHS